MMYERIQLNLEGYGLTKLELQIRIFHFFPDFQTTVNLAILRNFAIYWKFLSPPEYILHSMQVKYIKENTMQIHCRAKLDYHRRG